MNPLEQLVLIGTVALSLVWPGALATPAPAKPEPTSPVRLTEAAPWPHKSDPESSPVIRAHSALLLDLPSGSTLYAKDPEAIVPIASITKLMTALLVVENLPPDRLVTVPGDVQASLEESRMGLRAGDQLTAEELLAGLLIASANDNAKLLAREVAGSEAEFVKRMNQRADELGMDDTEFFNPVGFGVGQENYSTARELVTLSRAALSEPRIVRWVGVRELTVTAHNLPLLPPGSPPPPAPPPPTEYKLYTTNGLIGSYLPVQGLKTGTSDAAGPCLVAHLSGGDRQLLAIVLNSPDRTQETKSMFDWALRAYRW